MTQILCAYDECCTLNPPKGVSNLKYCPTHRCKRRAENSRKSLEEAELFEDPQEFRTHHVTREKDGTRILIINDLHRPFHDRATLQAIEKFWDDYKPHYEVYNGDIADLYSISQFDKNPSRRFSFKQECADTRGWLFSRAEANPGAKRIYIDGNHEDRMRRWLWKHGPELSSLDELEVGNLLGIDEIAAVHLPYPGVFDFLGFRIEHGYKTTMSKAYPVDVARWMAVATASSGLCAHVHRLGKYLWSDSRGSHSYIVNGCVCKLSLEYAADPNWQHGFTYGEVHKGKVHLVMVHLYSDGFLANGEFYPRLNKGR